MMGAYLVFVKIGWLEHMLWPKHEICTLCAQRAYLAKKVKKLKWETEALILKTSKCKLCKIAILR